MQNIVVVALLPDRIEALQFARGRGGECFEFSDRRAEGFERLVEPGREMNAEMHMVGHHHPIEERDRRIETRQRGDRLGDDSAERRKRDLRVADAPEKRAAGRGGDRDEKRGAPRVVVGTVAAVVF